MMALSSTITTNTSLLFCKGFSTQSSNLKYMKDLTKIQVFLKVNQMEHIFFSLYYSPSDEKYHVAHRTNREEKRRDITLLIRVSLWLLNNAAFIKGPESLLSDSHEKDIVNHPTVWLLLPQLVCNCMSNGLQNSYFIYIITQKL